MNFAAPEVVVEAGFACKVDEILSSRFALRYVPKYSIYWENHVSSWHAIKSGNGQAYVDEAKWLRQEELVRTSK